MKWLLIGIAVLVLTGGAGGLSSLSTSSPTGTTGVKALDDVTSAVTGKSNAQRTAEDYLQTQSFSRKSLIHQLEFEGYTHSQAVQGVDATNADWYAQAAGSAKEYLQTQGFSRSGLIGQLEFDGYTASQATYGVNQAY